MPVKRTRLAARRYRKIDLAFTDQPAFRALSQDARYLVLQLLITPRSQILPGVVSIGPHALAEELDWEWQRLCHSFDEAAKGFVKADFKARLFWIPAGIEMDPPSNPNVANCFGKFISELPECGLKKEIVSTVREKTLALGKAFTKAFDQGFGKPLDQGFGKGLAQGLAHSPTPSPALTTTPTPKEKGAIKTPVVYETTEPPPKPPVDNSAAVNTTKLRNGKGNDGGDRSPLKTSKANGERPTRRPARPIASENPVEGEFKACLSIVKDDFQRSAGKELSIDAVGLDTLRELYLTYNGPQFVALWRAWVSRGKPWANDFQEAKLPIARFKANVDRILDKTKLAEPDLWLTFCASAEGDISKLWTRAIPPGLFVR